MKGGEGDEGRGKRWRGEKGEERRSMVGIHDSCGGKRNICVIQMD